MLSEKNQHESGIELDRRDFLKGAGASIGAAALLGLPSISCSANVSKEAIVRLSLTDGLEALRSGMISSVDYCVAALQQAAKFEDHNIFTQISREYVERAAANVDARRKQGESIGALQGVPYALKDSVDMVEYFTISGHPSLRTFRPSKDADLVKICKEADAICIGKTQIPALSMWWTTENPMTGYTGNPFNRAYKTGGSSGGSGAAVAARIVPFAIAEDTGGSVRVPAAVNGVQGFRPTTGRWPTDGTMPIGLSDTLGPIARSVADIKLLDSLCAVDRPDNSASQVKLRDVRVAWQQEGFFEDLHPWVQENVEQAMRRLSDAGATFVEIRGLPAKEVYDLLIAMLLANMPGNVASYFNRHGVYDRSLFGLMDEYHMEGIKKAWMPGLNEPPAGEAYLEMAAQLLDARSTYRKVMRDNDIDVLFYASTKVPNTPNDGDAMESTGPLGETISEESIGPNMMFAPAMRTPSISMYSGMDAAGLPLSVTFDGYSGDDRGLLDIAETLETVLPRLVEPDSA